MSFKPPGGLNSSGKNFHIVDWRFGPRTGKSANQRPTPRHQFGNPPKSNKDRVMLKMSVIITGSLLNMIMNEVEHGKWIMIVGRDTIDLSWIVVVIQSEAVSLM